MNKLDAEFFDSDWLMAHRDWFDSKAYAAQAAQNQYKRTPNKLFCRFGASDNRLTCYQPLFRTSLKPVHNIMVNL